MEACYTTSKAYFLLSGLSGKEAITDLRILAQYLTHILFQKIHALFHNYLIKREFRNDMTYMVTPAANKGGT